VTFVDTLLDIELKFAEVVKCVSLEEARNNRQLRLKTRTVAQLLLLIAVFKESFSGNRRLGGTDGDDLRDKKRGGRPRASRSRTVSGDHAVDDPAKTWLFNRELFADV